jgi:hypothetical protein
MRGDVVGCALEGQRDPGPVAPQALPRVIAVVGDLLTQQTGIELGESTRIGTVEHNGVEAANGNASRSVGHAEQPIGPASDMEVAVERVPALRGP